MRRDPYFLFHHNRTVDEKFVDSLIRNAAPVAYMSTPPKQPTENPRGSPEWEAQANRMLEASRQSNFASSMWSFPLEKPGRTAPKRLDSQIHITLKSMPFELEMYQMFVLPTLVADQQHWGMVNPSGSHLSWSETREMNWFLDKCRLLLPEFEPDFACADVGTTVVARLEGGADPRGFAWPLMVFGPEEVERIGRQKLLDAPAWKVEELPYGGIWLQVWENPFDTPQTDVAILARYLGLKER